MLPSTFTAITYALILALLSAALLVGVPRLLFALETRLRAWLAALEKKLEAEHREMPESESRPGSTLWPRISGPA